MFELGYNAQLFSEVIIPVHIPTNNVRRYCESKASSTTWYCQTFKFGAKQMGVKGYFHVSLTCISIITKDSNYHFRCSLAVSISSPQCFSVSAWMFPPQRECSWPLTMWRLPISSILLCSLLFGASTITRNYLVYLLIYYLCPSTKVQEPRALVALFTPPAPVPRTVPNSEQMDEYVMTELYNGLRVVC